MHRGRIALRCVADEDQRGHGAARTAKVPKRGKCVKNADNTEKTWIVQEKRANVAELSPMDPYRRDLLFIDKK